MKDPKGPAQDTKPPGEVVTPPAPTPGEDVDLRHIVRFGVGLTVVVAVVAGLLYVMMRHLAHQYAAADPKGPTPPGQARAVEKEYNDDNLSVPDGPVQLQRRPFDDIDALREREEKLLSSYGWVDQKGDVVRLPIELAMRLTVQRGLPTRSTTGAAPAPSAAPTAAPTAAPAATPRPTRRPAPRVSPTTTPETPAGDAQ
jgi:hypothetical protein